MNKNTFKKNNTKYEEINDYSFLNSLTEEIINLTDKNDLKNILPFNTLYNKTTNAISQIFSVKDYEDIIKIINNLEYKAVLHNVNKITYLELVSTNNKNYTLQVSENKICKVDNAILDNALSYLIENNNLKLSNE